MSQPASDNAKGSFSCDALNVSGSSSYYQLFKPQPPPAASSFETESTVPSSTETYYSLTGIPGPGPTQVQGPSLPYPVPAPGLDYSNSKAMNVDYRGGANMILAGNANFATRGVQYNTTGSYMVSGNAPPPGPDPNMAPSIPELATQPQSTSILLYFNVAGVTGTAPLTFAIAYGTTGLTTQVIARRANPSLSVYTAVVTGLQPSTAYQFASVVAASAPGGVLVSAPVTFSTSSGTGTAPTLSATLAIPQLTSKTFNSIKLAITTTSVTGTPTPVIGLLYGTDPLNCNVPFNFAQSISNIYEVNVTGLIPNTAYYFQTVASNGVSPNALSNASGAYTTLVEPPVPNLKTNIVTPFLIQGPRFGQTSPWAGIDYYLNVGAVGALLVPGATTTSGQQVFASMYAGTVGNAGNLSGDPGNIVPYAGSCVADQPFAWLGGGSGGSNYSDAYLNAQKTAMGANGRLLLSWGGFLADVLGLFGPFQPTGYPAGGTNPAVGDVIKSMCRTYLGLNSSDNPLSWVRINNTATSNWAVVYDGVVLDFENVGLGNPQNNYPYAPPSTPPSFPADSNNTTYLPYQVALASIPILFYNESPNKFIANAPVSLCIVADRGTTNICAPNTGLNNWYAFATATKPPTGPTGDNPFNTTDYNALNHPSSMGYLDDIFVQFYNEEADYYPGGQYFANLLACWGYAVIQAQIQGPKFPRINLGLAKGNIIPGIVGGVAVAARQGPTPQLGVPPNPTDADAPYVYWYPQYATASPPNYTAEGGWPNTGVDKDPINITSAITEANTMLQVAYGNSNLQPGDWLSGMGFWAGGDATAMAASVYNSASPLAPAGLPALQTYCWSDASYPAPNPNWTGSVPIQKL